jgi:hypothetical protein
MDALALSNRDEARALVSASPSALFEQLDDHRRLSAHMEKSSWMMLGSKMELRLDAGGGRAVGSRIRLVGRVLGVPLSVEETVTERTPPARKVWETLGTPRLLVIGPYRMGFEIAPVGAQSQLRVFIEYALPEGPTHWLARALAAPYARWCVRRMVNDAAMHFREGSARDAA